MVSDRDKLYNKNDTSPITESSAFYLTIRAAKYMYYESTFSRNKTNIRNTWKTINEIISKSPLKKQFPTFYRDGRKEINENCEIANKFNTLFTDSKNINYTGDKTYKTYLKEPNKVSLIFEKVSETNGK